MKYFPKILFTFFIACFLLSGCTTFSGREFSQLANKQFEINKQSCNQWLYRLDQLVKDNDVTDISASRVAKYPFLRVNRFLASFSSDVDVDPTLFPQWVREMQKLDLDGRGVELKNLSESALESIGIDRDEILVRTETCSSHLLTDVLSMSPSDLSARELRENAKVKDDYDSIKRFVGFYSLLKYPFSKGIEGWHEEAREEFASRREGEQVSDQLISYAGQRERVLPRVEVAKLLSKSGRLGHLDLNDSELLSLFATYAPVFAVETSGEYDEIGSLHWGTGKGIGVDVREPVVYTKLERTRFGGEVLPQLVYVAWFTERPKSGVSDMLAGKLDGIVWRVTLSKQGDPLIYDTMHPCGCYHMFFPTQNLVPINAPSKYEEWAFSPGNLPVINEGEQVVITINSRTHYVGNVEVASEEIKASVPQIREYELRAYDDLRTLQYADNQFRSIFGSDGLIPGTERGERFLFWPMGIDSAGAMRQWGSHATAFLGRRHFDDADLMQKRFKRTNKQ